MNLRRSRLGIACLAALLLAGPPVAAGTYAEPTKSKAKPAATAVPDRRDPSANLEQQAAQAGREAAQAVKQAGRTLSGFFRGLREGLTESHR